LDQRLGQGAVTVLTAMLINKGRRENMEQGRLVITKEQRKQKFYQLYQLKEEEKLEKEEMVREEEEDQ